MPDYFQNGMRLMEMVSRAGQKIAQLAERNSREIWDQLEG
jgi:hypothetical protein